MAAWASYLNPFGGTKLKATLTALAVLLFLAACVSEEEREAARHERCVVEWGAQPGTQAYGTCMVLLTQLDAQRRANRIAAYSAMQNSQSFQPPQQTVCQRYGNQVVCTPR